MSKRSSKRSYSKPTPSRVRRDVATIARRTTPTRLPRPVYLPLVSPLPPISDRRRYHPAGKKRPVFSSPRSASRLVAVGPKGKRDVTRAGRDPGRLTLSVIEAGFSQPAAEVGDFKRVGFAVPKRVAVCVRRGVRREVLFAKNQHGKGARNPVRRRSETSNVSC